MCGCPRHGLVISLEDGSLPSCNCHCDNHKHIPGWTPFRKTEQEGGPPNDAIYVGPPQEDCMSQAERDLAALKDWWLNLANEEFEKVGPKAIEYGAYDLQEIGRTLAYTMKRFNVSQAEAAEMGIYFYVVGKMGRWTDAIATNKQVSDDTLHDIGVYVRMAQRIRAVGAWPFLPITEADL